MSEIHIPPLLLQSIVYLGAAVLAVPISKRIGLGSVLGYLLAGIIIGPWGLGLISEPETVLEFAEFGVVMMLFLIGLEINLDKLWALRMPIFGLGGLQVGITLLVACLLALAFKLDWRLAVVAGMGIAMSSTAIAMQTLSERGVLDQPAGRAAFSVLLFQDLAVIPLMLLLALLVPGNAVALDNMAIFKAVALVLLIVVGGNYLLRPILRYVANTGLREIFIAFALFLVMGVALLMQLVGLSMALGAFLAGVLLADSEYRQELELDIEPFKGLLLGLFFIAVGMSVDLGLVLRQPLMVLGLALGLVVFKISLLYPLARVFKQGCADALLFALVLSQVGEFAFVIFSAAAQLGIVDAPTTSLLNAVVALSMLTTPLLMLLYGLWARRNLNRKTVEHDDFDTQRQVIIGGFGRFGQVIVRLLNGIGIAPTVIEHDPNQIELARQFGFKTYYGDISRPDVLRAAGIAQARLLVLAIDDPKDALDTARYVRKHYPQVRILARARNRTHAFDYMDLNIDAVRETFFSALRLGEKSLVELGFGSLQAHRAIRKFRKHDEARLRESHPVRHDIKKMVEHSHRSREDLAQLLQREFEHPLRDEPDDGPIDLPAQPAAGRS
jgi:glutathione-regulated potassium-efflux system ancillary protein KefC